MADAHATLTPVDTPRPAPPEADHRAYLDGLRGLLAAYVLGFHFLGMNLDGVTPALARPLSVFHFGHAAVGFFIVLSGYSLMLPVVRSATGSIRGGFRGYLVRRARRILPAYFGALGLSMAVVWLVLRLEHLEPITFRPEELSASSVLSHLLLVHNLVPGQHNAINMALWSIATEWHIYFLFPLILLPAWRKAGPSAMVFLAFAIGLLPQLVWPGGLGELRFGCPWYVGLFALGMTAAVIERTSAHPFMRTPWPLLAVFILATGTFLVVKRLSPGVDEGGRLSVQWLKDGAVGVVAWCLIMDCARRRTVLGRPSVLLRVLESRPAVFLGGFSYSLYVTHCAVFALFSHLTHRWQTGPTESLLIRMFIGIPIALALAYVFSKAFEAPFLKPRKTTRIAEPVGATL